MCVRGVSKSHHTHTHTLTLTHMYTNTHTHTFTLAHTYSHTQRTTDINVRNDQRRTPLHTAVIEGYPRVIEKLVGYGAELNAVEDEGNTPLHITLIKKAMKPINDDTSVMNKVCNEQGLLNWKASMQSSLPSLYSSFSIKAFSEISSARAWRETTAHPIPIADCIILLLMALVNGFISTLKTIDCVSPIFQYTGYYYTWRKSVDCVPISPSLVCLACPL